MSDSSPPRVTLDAPTGESLARALEPFISQVESSLLVVTTGIGDELSGCLVGFATQCSLQPPRFIVCISKVNHTFFVIERSKAVAIHLLKMEQLDLASLFGEYTGDSIDKFSHCRWHRGRTLVPVLDDCAAWIEGRVLRRFGVGDHEALVVQPLGGGGGTGAKVLTFQNAPQLRAGHPVDV